MTQPNNTIYNDYHYNDDKWEPNNSANKAYNIGSISSDHSHSYFDNAAIGFSGDEDWYRFKLDSNGGNWDRIFTSYNNDEGNIDFFLYDANLNRVSSFEGEGNDEYISLQGLSAGEYYLQVYGVDGATNPHYSLDIKTHDTYNDSNEPNNDFSNVTDLRLIFSQYDYYSYGAIYPSGDQDWYQFELSETGGIWNEIYAWFDRNYGDVNITLYDAEQNAIASSATVDTDEEYISLEGLPPGEYYLQVYGAGDNTSPNYDLNIVAYGAKQYYSQHDDYELNNSASQAYDLGILGSYTDYARIEPSNDEDWYRFTTDRFGGVWDEVYIWYDEEEGNVDLALYDANLELIASSTTIGNDEEHISFEGLAPGEYYLQVYSQGENSHPYYDFGIYVNGHITEDNYEPNNSASQAYNLGLIDSYHNSAELESNEDEDWYRFKIAQTGGNWDEIFIWYDEAVGNIDFALYDAEQNFIVSSTKVDTDKEYVSLKGLAPGEYYFQVYGETETTSLQYDFSIYADSDNTQDNYESNNSASQAYDLGVVSNYISDRAQLNPNEDEDWYKFEITQTGGILDEIYVWYDENRGNVDVALYDTQLNRVANSTEGELISLRGLKAGEYYLQVYGFEGSTSPSYDFSIDIYGDEHLDTYYINTANYEDLYENNNTAETATQLGTIDNRFSDYGMNLDETGDRDWYQFELNENNSRDGGAYIFFYHYDGKLDLTLYTAEDTTNPIAISEGVDDYQYIAFDNLEAGNYYLEVSNTGEETNSYYGFDIFAGYLIEPETEPNSPVEIPEIENGMVYDTHAAGEDYVQTTLSDDVLALGTDADYDNLVGFYEVTGTNGGIDTNDDGVDDLLPEDNGYARAALTNTTPGWQIRAGSGRNTVMNTTVEEFGNIVIAGGKMYAPFVIVHGGEIGINSFIAAELAENDGWFNDAANSVDDLVAYFAYQGANPDGAVHIKPRDGGAFGFEDLPANLNNVSDNDFDDAIFKFDFNSIS